MSIRVAITVLLTVGMASCQQDAPPPATPVEAEPMATNGYVSPGKPNVMPVNVKYRLLDTPEVGQPVRIELTLVSSIASAGLGFDLQAEHGLTVAPDSLSRTFAPLPARTPETTVVTVTPQMEGRFYLRVAANVVAGGDSKTRIVTIPIQVGEGTRPLQSHGEIKTDAEGNPVVSLPAQVKEE